MMLKSSQLTFMDGFSLMELLIALVIIAVLAMLSAPSFNKMIVENKLLTSTQDITAAYKRTRSEAIKRSRSVSICPSDDGLSCSDTNNMSNGWIIFIDSTTPGVVDNSNAVTAGGDIILYHNRSSGNTSGLELPEGSTYTRFNSQGFLVN